MLATYLLAVSLITAPPESAWDLATPANWSAAPTVQSLAGQ